MKICILIGSLRGGGAERMATILANSLKKQNHDVTLINFEKKEDEYLLESGISRYFLQHTNIVNDILDLNKYIKQIEADIYISIDIYFNILAGFCKRINKIKVIMSERNDPRNVNIRTSIKLLRNISYKYADGIVFQTIEARNYFKKVFTVKSSVIPNPIKKDLPRRNSNCKNVIVAVGRLSKQKNYLLLLNVFEKISKKYPEYQLVIFGEGEEKTNIINHIRQLKLESKVHINNFTSELHDKIKDYKIYVLSSDYEGIPNSLLEALGMGFPVVASNTPSGGTKSLIDHSVNGFLFQPMNEEEFYKYLSQLIDDENLQKMFSKNALIVNDKFSEEIIVKQWVSFIEEIVNNHV
ncbi:MAG: glycosyltransferase [Beduini sp.]|uniref:glycosyltransferase n=1 Tax=Beduini sp. TaxID=1922300 RepID=UPI003990A503